MSIKIDFPHFPPLDANSGFLTSDSDSARKTVHIAGWKGLESEILVVKIQTSLKHIQFVFVI